MCKGKYGGDLNRLQELISRLTNNWVGGGVKAAAYILRFIREKSY